MPNGWLYALRVVCYFSRRTLISETRHRCSAESLWMYVASIYIYIFISMIAVQADLSFRGTFRTFLPGGKNHPVEKHEESSLFIAPSPHPWTDFDDVYVTWRVSAQGSAGFGSCWYCSPYWGVLQEHLYRAGYTPGFATYFEFLIIWRRQLRTGVDDVGVWP